MPFSPEGEGRDGILIGHEGTKVPEPTQKGSWCNSNETSPSSSHLALGFMSTGNFASLGRVQDFYLLHFSQNFNKAVNQNQTPSK